MNRKNKNKSFSSIKKSGHFYRKSSQFVRSILQNAENYVNHSESAISESNYHDDLIIDNDVICDATESLQTSPEIGALERNINANPESLIDHDYCHPIHNNNSDNLEHFESDTLCNHKSFTTRLSEWALKFNIAHQAIRSLLTICSEHYNLIIPSQIPKDPRTLLQTPRESNISQMGTNGFFWYSGLKENLNNVLKAHITTDTSISLNINIDGLPLFKSSVKQVWPILVNIHVFETIKPIAVAVFYGDCKILYYQIHIKIKFNKAIFSAKPEDPNLFLELFVEELKELTQTGLIINDATIMVKIRCLICDTPARAMIKG